MLGRHIGRCLSAALMVSLGASILLAQHGHGSEGVGKAHMETSCAPAVQARFDRALAVLHNFWYARALTQFQDIQKADPECAMAYWGAAMTYNHPFWDAPSREDEAAAWGYVQKGLKARSQNDREHMYLEAVAALYKDAGAGTKQSRDEAYRERMAATYAKYPDDETTLFHGLSILSTIREGTKGFEMQGRAVALFESVYAHNQQHPGVLHYLIHAYDDPVHAQAGLVAARAYAKTAAAVPHAYHMPSHIFTRLGYWDEAATTNENAWQISNDDVKAAGEPGELRDFHALNYLSYNYLQLGRYKDAQKTVDLFAAQDKAMANRGTAPDSQDLQARHVRGRTIFALPDRVLYGYFDTLARFIVESESWNAVPDLTLVAPSSDFVVMKLHLEVMAAAARKDAATARTKAAEMMERARVPGQHPFVQQILTIQAREAAASAAVAAGDAAGALTEMDAAVAIEDAIDSLPQPPYPIVPAHELYGSMLMDMGRPAEARRHFEETLRRTPGRPKAIAGLARAAEATGDTATARAQYTRLTEMWKSADRDRPELVAARRFLSSGAASRAQAPSTPAPTHADLEYAPAEPAGSNGHKLDLYIPGGTNRAWPVVIWTGGSAWMADSGKRTAPALAAQLTPAGYAVAGVSIRSSSQVKFPGQLHDIKAAIRWLRANASKYHLDPDRIAIMGDSSGGWTTAMAALTGDVPELEGTVGTTGPSSKVRAAVAFYPPTNFLTMDAWALRKCDQPRCHDDETSPESRLVGCAIQTCPENVQAANPLRYVTPADPPMMILHGDSDPLVPHNQGEQLYMALNKACLDAVFISLPKAGHGPWNGFLTDDAIREGATSRSTSAAGCAVTNPSPFTPTWKTVVDFLDKHAK